jgi:hypothetical protein
MTQSTATITIVPKVAWIDLPLAKQTLTLPFPWNELLAQGFHEDLTDRAYAHLAYAKHYGGEENARAVLTALGEGFVRPFERSRFSPHRNDPNGELKTKALDALEELAHFFGNRVSAVVWEAFAHLASRQDPEVEKSIIKEASAGTLPHHYTLIDSALHASGLVYTFILHVNSVMFRHTGRILNHNCDCSCSLINLEAIGGCIDYALPQANVKTATQSVFTHLLAETDKLMERFLPFAYSITPEAREIKELM